jgi:hypothetical protein
LVAGRPVVAAGRVFVTDFERPTYEDSEPVLLKGPLVDQPLGLDRGTLDAILAETM